MFKLRCNICTYLLTYIDHMAHIFKIEGYLSEAENDKIQLNQGFHHMQIFQINPSFTHMYHTLQHTYKIYLL